MAKYFSKSEKKRKQKVYKGKYGHSPKHEEKGYKKGLGKIIRAPIPKEFNK